MCPRLLSFVASESTQDPRTIVLHCLLSQADPSLVCTENKCPLCGRLFFLRAHHIITYLHLFFDIFHGLKKIAKKDKPGTAITAALPGLSLIFFISLFFLLPLASLLPVKKLLSPPPKAFPLKKRHFDRSRLFLSAFLERADRFI